MVETPCSVRSQVVEPKNWGGVEAGRADIIAGSVDMTTGSVDITAGMTDTTPISEHCSRYSRHQHACNIC